MFKRSKASPYFGLPYVISINGQRIRIEYQSQEGEEENCITVSWKKITELLDFKDGFVFMFGKTPLFFITRFNKSDTDLQNIRIMATENLVSVVR